MSALMKTLDWSVETLGREYCKYTSRELLQSWNQSSEQDMSDIIPAWLSWTN
jgi:hypothetical protein